MNNKIGIFIIKKVMTSNTSFLLYRKIYDLELRP